MKTFLDLSAQEQNVLIELRLGIQKEFPNCSFRLTLFGSRARGDAEADSDVDVLVEILSDCISFEEKRQVRRLAGDLSLSSGLVLSLLIAEGGEFSIFRNIREKGLAL